MIGTTIPCLRRASRLLSILLPAILLPACAPGSLVEEESFASWCGEAPCGWQTATGSATPVMSGAALGPATTLTRATPFDLSFDPQNPFPGYLAVLTRGEATIDVGWLGGASLHDTLHVSNPEPTYVYLSLDPGTATGFSVSLETAPSESAWFGFAAITRCAPSTGDNRFVQFGTGVEDDFERVISFYWVPEAQDDGGFGHECPSGGGGDDGSGGD